MARRRDAERSAAEHLSAALCGRAGVAGDRRSDAAEFEHREVTPVPRAERGEAAGGGGVMTARASAHFDEDTATRWQMGEATEVERTHLDGCVECQAQARPLADALSCFGAAAREWGEERAAVTREWRVAKAAQEWRESRAAAARSWRTMFAAWVTVSVALL